MLTFDTCWCVPGPIQIFAIRGLHFGVQTRQNLDSSIGYGLGSHRGSRRLPPLCDSLQFRPELPKTPFTAYTGGDSEQYIYVVRRIKRVEEPHAVKNVTQGMLSVESRSAIGHFFK